MKIKFALTFYLKDSFGGAERRLTRIYNELCAENDNLVCDIVVRGCDKKTAMKIFEQADCETKYIHKIIACRWSCTCLAYLLCSWSYRIIHFFCASDFNIAVEKICNITRKKSIYTVCGYDEACNVSLSEEQEKRVQKQLFNADYVDVLNPSGEKNVRRYTRGVVSTTPGTFTDLNIFSPKKKQKNILYAAARLNNMKNPMLLVDAVNICQKEIRAKGYRVILLGKGELEQDLKEAIHKYQLEDIIEMPGYEKSSAYTPEASVFLSLQSIENYPSQSIAEAVASGCYLIITDVGDSRKCAEETFATFINNDALELANAIKEYIMKNQFEKEEIVIAARGFAEKNYNITKSKRYFRKIILDLMEGVKSE